MCGLKSGSAAIRKADKFQAIQKITTVYAQTTGSSVRAYDHNCRPLFDVSGDCAVEEKICAHCFKFSNKSFENIAEPCHETHADAIRESNHTGGKYLYSCQAGLIFWVSPIFDEGQFSGALRATGVICADYPPGNTEMSRGFIARLRKLPQGSREKIKSLVEMLHFCTASLSSGSENYHEIIKRRIEQQKNIGVKIEELKMKYSNNELPGYPIKKEQRLITALREGDSKEAADLLDDILAILFFSNANHFRYIQLRAIELAVLLSRIDIDCSQKGNSTLEANSRDIRQIREAKTFEDLTDTMHSMVKRVSGILASFQGLPHAAVIRKAECFIQANFTRKISLSEVAAVSGLSAPYFSTVFKEEMGENLSKYLNRLRVEKAGRMLLETDISLNKIAGACCFEDQSWFSKTFKSYTGISPGKYRSQGGGMVREISDTNIEKDYLDRSVKRK